jgi:hypothetical protein
VAAVVLWLLVLSASASGAVRHVGAVSWTVADQPHPTQAPELTDWDLARDSGADHGRLNVSWRAVDGTIEGQPDPGALEDRAECTTPLYRWCQLDRSVLGYAVIGQRVNPVLIGAPEWANPAGCQVQENADACHPRLRYHDRWADFVRAAVDRYGPGGIFPVEYQMGTWEVWNEPDIASYWDGDSQDDPRRDARQYARLVSVTHEAVPQIRIAGPSLAYLGGLAGRPWLDAFAKHPVAHQFDVISGHLYAASPAQVGRHVDRYRRVLPRRTLWITELGFGSGDEYMGSEEGQQAAFDSLMGELNRRPFVKSLTWFAGARHDAFGGTHNLYRWDGSPKPIVEPFREAAAAR